MKIGIDTMTIHPLRLSPMEALNFAARHQLDGIQFGAIHGLSKNLDPGELREIRSHADSLNLYTHVSVPPPNPLVGGGSVEDHVASIRHAVEAAATCGWHELHSLLGNDQNRYHGKVDWKTQLNDSREVLRALAPALRHHGSRINLETHAEATTFELVRMAEDVGPDVVGICLDTANVFCFAEDPVAAARRAAPYTHLTHTKDAIIYFSDRGIIRQGRPPGQGALDWEAILTTLADYSPDLPLSIEDHKWLFEMPVFEEEWHAQQADLSRAEFGRVMAIAWEWQKKIISGECPPPEVYEAIPYEDQLLERLHSGRDFLRALLQRLNLAMLPRSRKP